VGLGILWVKSGKKRSPLCGHCTWVEDRDEDHELEEVVSCHTEFGAVMVGVLLHTSLEWL